jgi:hypothetical protein
MTGYQPSKPTKAKRNVMGQLGKFMMTKFGKRQSWENRRISSDSDEEDDITSLESFHQQRQQILEQNAKSKKDSKGKSKMRKAMNKLKVTVGATELMRELRLRREEYGRKMKDIVKRLKASNLGQDQDHPYLALRKKIETMAWTIGIGTPYMIDCNKIDTNLNI